MTPELYSRICDIVSDAQNVGDEKLDAFVTSACNGNTTLVRQVMRFLSTDEDCSTRFDALLEAPSVDVRQLLPTHDKQETDQPKQIGPYQVLEKIGEGGHGIVYRGAEERPVHRIVAIKLLSSVSLRRRPSELVKRFQTEYQVLEILRDHPLIPDFYTCGVTEDGQHWFSMEFVRGVPLSQYVRDNKLGLSDRLRLFVEVCDAVAFAHEHGVLHRDLKPSNILIETQFGSPVPKIIDFGLARAEQLTGRNAVTEIGRPIGTAEYMSPEQAEISPQGVDKRTDIYSLGVILYQLITERLPIPSECVRSSSSLNMRRAIVESKIEPPSSHAPNAKGELDWITLKAIENSPSQRYQSVTELAADLKSYLSGGLVMAHPPSLAYRLRKTIMKHQTDLVIAVVCAAAVAGAFTGRVFGLVAAIVGLVILILGGGMLLWLLQQRASRAETANRTTEAKLSIAHAELASLRQRLHSNPAPNHSLGGIAVAVILFCMTWLMLPASTEHDIHLQQLPGLAAFDSSPNALREIETIINDSGDTLTNDALQRLLTIISNPSIQYSSLQVIASVIEDVKPDMALQLRDAANQLSTTPVRDEL